jgi:hypothetical protein
MKLQYCECHGTYPVTDVQGEFGYILICTKCKKPLKDSYTTFNHFDGEDHEMFWGAGGQIIDDYDDFD